MASLTFLGAAGTVTGSQYLLEVNDQRVLVDCGMFQGLKALRERNWARLPVHPASVHAVVLTHAHLDHSGLLPRLVSNGFAGRIFCTAGTSDLCKLVLPDAARLQEEDARRANKGRYSKHTPALPLFTESDASEALSRLQPFGFNRAAPIAPGLEADFINAGHLLGSAYVRVRRSNHSGGTILFGGDLGRYDRPVLPDPSPGVECDVLLLESTYGNRLHPPEDDGARLADIINDTAKRDGKLIIPSFAIGRVEEVLYWLKRLEDSGRVPVLPVYVDSPMALGALEYYRRHAAELDPDVRPARGEVCAFCTSRFSPVASARESQEVVDRKGPAIIISASGMATGGRVLHHLVGGLSDPRNTVLFVGFQAAGTRGRDLIEGAHRVKMYGQFIPVQARIDKLNAMSAHADAGEVIRWLRTFPRAPGITYLVHGEPPAQEALKARIERELGWKVHIPAYRERVDVAL
ncbi:MAG TPA: MBL fold metallo-hydrolase [Vicinamibacterales bacterium]|nr:MBL fold metallo-hydrolase [Vicinamibacterales bacterium]